MANLTADGGAKPRSPIRSWPRWKRMLLFAAPAVLLWFLGEIAGRVLERIAGYRPRRAASYASGNPYLRTALVPGVRFQSGPYRIEVNSLGFRGPEIAVPKRPGTFRIFALGESTTFGWKGNFSHEDAWPGRLQAKLRATYPGRLIEVVNAGVPGYTSIEQRINFMLRISRLEPDAILIYHGNNDLGWSWVPDLETKLIYGRGPGIGPPGRWARLLDYSYVLMELRSRLDLFSRDRRVKHDDVDSVATRVLRRNLEGLVDDARRANVRVAIATFAHGLNEAGQPGAFSEAETRLGVPAVSRWFDYLSPQGLRRSFPVYNRMVRDLAVSHHLPLAEPGEQLPKTSEYFTDWCHFTAKGEEVMANTWLDTITRAGWLDSVPPKPD